MEGRRIMTEEIKFTKTEKFEVEIDTDQLPDPEERIGEDGYEEPVVEEIQETLKSVEGVESVRKVEK